MPRPKKQRHCECRMSGKAFKPTGIPMGRLAQIPMGRDELETLRLCDLEALTQEEAGARMKISRGTVQRLLKSARAKSARALSQGAAIIFTDP
ncbi:DUF134 domain-containing protein [Desulfobacterota bacterium M19]